MKKMLKNLAAVAVAFAIVCAVFPFAGVSAVETEFNVAVTADAAWLTYGDTVVVTVAIDSITAAGGLLSVDIPFRFDADVFEFVSKTVAYPSAWQNPQDFSYTTAKNGLLWLRALEDSEQFSSTVGCTEDRAICFKVTLKVKSNAKLGSTQITTNGDGVFEVACGTCADGQCTVAYGAGQSFSATVSDSLVKLGDVNGDGSVNSLDAALILKYAAGLVSLTESQLAAGDCDDNGEVNSIDAAFVLRTAAGL